MRLVDLFQVVASVVFVLVVPREVVRRRVIGRLTREGATTVGSACPAPERPFLARMALERLAAAGIVCRTDDGRVYLDCVRMAAWRAARRRRALMAGAAATVGLLVLAWLMR